MKMEEKKCLLCNKTYDLKIPFQYTFDKDLEE